MGKHRFVRKAALVGAAWIGLAAGAWGAGDKPLGALRELAEHGDVQAALRLATAYDSGMGVPRDDFEAGRWYEAAARLGDPDAQFRLGVLFREGRGVMKDLRKAYAWFDLAAANSEFLDRDDAAEYRDRAASELDASQLAVARGFAKAWRASP